MRLSAASCELYKKTDLCLRTEKIQATESEHVQQAVQQSVTSRVAMLLAASLRVWIFHVVLLNHKSLTRHIPERTTWKLIPVHDKYSGEKKAR